MPHNQNSPRENVHTKRIAEDIARAFRDVGYPGDDRIAYDQTGNHLECCEVVKAFQRKRWRDIDINTLARESSAIYFFTPAAFAYYLPAFLNAALLHHDSSDALPSTIINSFVLPSHHIDRLAYSRRIATLSSRQLAVIRAVLLHLKTFYPDDNITGDIDRAVDQLDREHKQRNA